MISKFSLIAILLILSFSALAQNVTTNKAENNTSLNGSTVPLTKVELSKPIEVKNINDSIFDSSLVQIIAIAISAALLLLQLYIQHKNSISLKKQETISELKLKIYENLVAQISDCSSKLSKVGVVGILLPNNILGFRESVGNNPEAMWTGITADDFSKEFFSATESVADLMILLERYEIVFPHLNIFRWAFHVAIDESNQAFHLLYGEILGYVAWNSTPDGNRPRFLADDPKIKRIRELGSDFHEKVGNASSYVSDLGVEAQNILMGDLFENKVAIRKPLDPKYIVIKTDEDSIKKLEDHFRNNTESGKRWSQYQSEYKD